MGTSRHRLRFGIVILFLSFSNILAYADWNADYYHDSWRLMCELSPMNNPFYFSKLMVFKDLREVLLKDSLLKGEIQLTNPADKTIYIRKEDDCIIKKRPHNKIVDAFVWEPAPPTEITDLQSWPA